MPVTSAIRIRRGPAGRPEDHRTDFIIAPQVRFKGEAGEQSTMFFRDPSGNPTEIKGFADLAGVFAG